MAQLTGAKAELVQLILSGHTQSSAAKKLNRYPSQITNWMRTVEVQSALAEARRERHAAASELLDAAVPRAVRVLILAMDSEKAPWAVRVKAASEIVQLSGIVPASKSVPEAAATPDEALTPDEFDAALTTLAGWTLRRLQAPVTHDPKVLECHLRNLQRLGDLCPEVSVKIQGEGPKGTEPLTDEELVAFLDTLHPAMLRDALQRRQLPGAA